RVRCPIHLTVLWFFFLFFQVGLDAGGKTTILYKLKEGELVIIFPTTGFNLETINYRNLSINLWDLGGQGNLPLLWKCYIDNTKAIIFVVDSADTERLDQAAHHIRLLFDNPDLREAKFLVFANKQDLPNAITCAELIKVFKLHENSGQQWHIQPSNAVTGEGVAEGLEWLHSAILKG
ncbi:ADP-ribosylation factor family protein, partial [Oesophagostomum dentatum]